MKGTQSSQTPLSNSPRGTLHTAPMRPIHCFIFLLHTIYQSTQTHASQSALLQGARATGLHASEEESSNHSRSSMRESMSTPRSLFAWGRNNAGQLGLGHRRDISSPELLTSFLSKETQDVAVGGYDESGGDQGCGFSLVVTLAGQVFAFGCNTHGQLGVGDTADRLAMVPVRFPGSPKIEKVTAGKDFALAVSREGKVYSWGSNANGQLGLGDTRLRLTPEQVTGDLSKHEVKSVSAGAEHGVAITQSGLLFSWGGNRRGQLGDGSDVATRDRPEQMSGALTGLKFSGVAAGLFHTLAVAKNGEVYAWGGNEKGQLGLGDLNDRRSPMAILSRFTRSHILSVAAGALHSMAVTDLGDIFTWGSNDCGQLGHEMKNKKVSLFPKRVETIRSKFIWAGARISGSILGSGRLFLWGCGPAGELGFGEQTTRLLPHIVLAPRNVQFERVALGGNHVLAVSKNGELYGWGRNDHGQLGLYFSGADELRPTLIQSTSTTDVVSIITGGYAYEYQGHSMAVTASGNVFTWGWNAFGQLGTGNLDAGSATVMRLQVLDDPQRMVSMAMGQYNTIAVTARKDSTSVYSWGPNYANQLGHKFMDLGPVSEPSKIETLKERIVQVAMGYSHALALTDTGAVYAWGSNGFGQLGTGDSKPRTKPTVLHAFRNAAVVHVAAGQQSSFAITDTGLVYAWGYNADFALGLGEGIDRNSPQMVRALTGQNVTTIAAGGYHAIACTKQGELFAWGNNLYGQLGLGHKNQVMEPTLVPGVPKIARTSSEDERLVSTDVIAAGTWHSVVAVETGDVYTWGRDDYGQLGLGERPKQDGLSTREGIATPQKVEGLEGCHVGGVAAAASHSFALGTLGSKWNAL